MADYEYLRELLGDDYVAPPPEQKRDLEDWLAQGGPSDVREWEEIAPLIRQALRTRDMVRPPPEVRVKHLKAGSLPVTFYVEVSGPGGAMSAYNAFTPRMGWSYAQRLAGILGVKVRMSATTAQELAKVIDPPLLQGFFGGIGGDDDTRNMTGTPSWMGER